MRTRSLGLAAALASASLLLGGVPAAADGGACTNADGRVPCTILRPPAPPARVPPVDAPECIVAVGGLGSGNDDGTFATLLAPFAGDERYEVHRFGGRGEEPARFPYDTVGPLDANARALVAFVRSLSERCHAIHLVAHSMGGSVADRAFSLGLSAADGVATYLPISSPHNGATLARILTLADDLDPAGNDALREIADRLRAVGVPVQDITTAAARDLAAVTPPRPARGVVELRQRLASDEFVLLPDHEDRRVDVRDVLPVLRPTDPSAIASGIARLDPRGIVGGLLSSLADWEGHGGSLTNDAVRATTESVIRRGAVPLDDRSAADKVLVLALSVAFAILLIRATVGFTQALGRGILLGRGVAGAVRALLPRADAAWWTSSWPALVDDATTIARKELAFEKGVVTRLSGAIDRVVGAAEDDVDELTGHRVRLADPRVALVRAVLGRAAAILARL